MLAALIETQTYIKGIRLGEILLRVLVRALDWATGCAGSVLRVLNDSRFLDLRGYSFQLSSHAFAAP